MLQATVLPAGAAVQADAVRVHQVLGQLLGHAVARLPAGASVSLTVAAVPTGWALTLSDDGPALPPAQRAQLFEPFSEPGSAGIGGAGVGLALTRALVERMGGRIAWGTPDGAGTRLVLTLPAAA